MAHSRKPRPTFCAELALFQEGYQWIAGTDEVGVGSAAGPAVAAAVLLHLEGDQNQVELYLEELAQYWWEVRDSKDIADSKKIRIDALIRERVQIGIGTVDEVERNVLRGDLATKLATERALMSLATTPEAVLIDGGVSLPEGNYLCRRVPKDKVQKATTSLSISAASIVANVHFNNVLCAYHESFPEYGFVRHKGYLTREHICAIQEYGVCPVHILNRDVRRYLKEGDLLRRQQDTAPANQSTI